MLFARRFDIVHRALARPNDIDVQNRLIEDEFEQRNDYIADLHKRFASVNPQEMPPPRALYYMQNMFNTLFEYYNKYSLDGLRLSNMWTQYYYSYLSYRVLSFIQSIS